MMLVRLLGREIKTVLRHRADVLNPLTFLFLAVMLFAVAVPTRDADSAVYGGAFLWLIVLLTNMLALDGLFRRDYESGVLEQIMATAQVPFLFVGLRIFMQWLSGGFLITLLSPLLCLLLGLPFEIFPVVVLSLLAGTPALSLLGAIGAALTVGFARGGVLLGLLVLPLYLPVLIFGAGVINEQLVGVGGTAQLYWLAFISMVALTIGPFATTAGLKISLQMQ
ncbi:MAG: heme exporter protein CcmB [Pseudomonadota bacterium]